MNAPRQTPATDIIGPLVDHAPIKVWSYLATIFGDLACGPGDEIGGVVLSALTERAGIRPEAMRVALHRLRKDEWIVARRQGRNSRYRLSERGLAETLHASRRIYARTVERPDLWHLLIADPASAAPVGRGGCLKVSPGILLGPGPCPTGAEEFLTLEFTRMTVPPWLLRNAVPEDSRETYTRLTDLMARTGEALDGAAPLAPLDRATIRLLALHHWRRAILRHSPLVEMLHDDDWIGTTCRTASAALLDRLPRPAPDDLTAP